MSLTTSTRVRTPLSQVWNRYRSDIEQLYIAEKCTLKQVMEVMAAKGLNASEQQYKIKFKEWGFSKYKKRGMQNRADRGDPRRNQIDRATVPIQLPNPHPPPTSLTDASIEFMEYGDIFTGYTPNDLFSTTSKPINPEIPEGEGTVAPLMPRASGTKFRQFIRHAAYSGFLDMVKFLLEKDPTCAAVASSNGATAIFYAAQEGHLEVVRHLLLLNYYSGIDVNAITTDTMRTPIHQAAQKGYVDIVKLLLTVNAKHDQPDNENITPLWLAAQQGYDEIVQILIDKGADKEVIWRDRNRRPIHQAAQNGHLGVVKKLLEAGAKVDPDNDSYDNETPSPLWLAAQGGHIEVSGLLIKKGANVNFSKHPSKCLPIHQAAQSGHIEVVRLLIGNNADVDARTEDGFSPLMLAALANHVEVINLLLEHGASVNAKDKDGTTALHLASMRGHVQVIQKLLDEGAKFSAARSLQARPIHSAAYEGHIEAVKLLLNRDSDEAHSKTVRGSTPLYLASQGKTVGHLEVVRYLLMGITRL